MKTSLKLLFLMLTTKTAFAQDPDKVLARVRYTYTIKTDTLKNGKERTENMILFVGKNASLFTSMNKISYERSEDQKNLARSISRAGMGSGVPTAVKIDRSAGEWLTKTNYLFFNKEKKMITKEEIIGTSYLIEEAIPEINWKITKDTATFSGLACQKATATYEDKNWTAWFAPSLPFQSGPWKLQGLPGLIVDAFDENKAVQFEFSGFEKASEGDFVRANDIRKRPNAVAGDINTVDVGMGLDVAGAYFDNTILLSTYRTAKTTRKEYDRLKAAYQKDPRGFSKAQYGF
ncbi:GLPGLI family protein [Pedobacter sp. Du54]|uniref:GLPGLI family protein n=1 Tax=Pedobacter anseongensis TaxID=3133439 RepID=UPI0030949359